MISNPNEELEMSEATIILTNMCGGCATEGHKVHALFRVTGRIRRNAGTSNHDSSDIREPVMDLRSGSDLTSSTAPS
jgi:hypothetical protein